MQKKIILSESEKITELKIPGKGTTVDHWYHGEAVVKDVDIENKTIQLYFEKIQMFSTQPLSFVKNEQGKYRIPKQKKQADKEIKCFLNKVIFSKASDKNFILSSKGLESYFKDFYPEHEHLKKFLNKKVPELIETASKLTKDKNKIEFIQKALRSMLLAFACLQISIDPTDPKQKTIPFNLLLNWIMENMDYTLSEEGLGLIQEDPKELKIAYDILRERLR